LNLTQSSSQECRRIVRGTFSLRRKDRQGDGLECKACQSRCLDPPKCVPVAPRGS
jgi:hypothetical protein